MTFNPPIQSIFCTLTCVLIYSSSILAQQPPRQEAKPVLAPQTTQLDRAAASGSTFSQPVQSALEAGDTRTALKLCGGKCKTDTRGTLSSGQPGSTRDYQCQNGNCACTSIPDCVAMTEVCAPGTTGCNDYGCTCAEKEAEADP